MAGERNLITGNDLGVFWHDVSRARCEIFLMKVAFQHSCHAYYMCQVLILILDLSVAMWYCIYWLPILLITLASYRCGIRNHLAH